ncbi:MAG: CCA tRNA nucleotidyltransferase [Aquificae bacterium]|nr:CCA tRNA nucleotidyltransferase [Aquificota bacterium]
MFSIEKLLNMILQRQHTKKEEREDIQIEGKFVHGLIFYNSYFDVIAKAFPKQTLVFIVGGWIRDRLINRPLGNKIDVDFIVTQDPIEIVKNIRKILGRGEYFSFEKEKTIATIVFQEGDLRYRFDFSFLDISDVLNSNLDFYKKEEKILEKLEQDLLSRDFTINAMAVNFDDVLGLSASQTILFDPSGGLEDLNEGIVRPISIENIQKDPVRIIRGFRIAQELDFVVEKQFQQWVSQNKNLLKGSPIERIRDEILKIFDNENSFRTVDILIQKKLFQEIIPQIYQMEKIKKQEKYHKYPLIKHSLKALEYVESLIKKKEKFFIDDRFLTVFGSKRFLAEFNDITMLKLATFFHDIGKAFVEKKEGIFHKHDEEGYKIFDKIAKRLALGNKASSFCKKLIKNHLAIPRLFFLKQLEDISKEQINFFWYENKDIFPHLVLLTLADSLATSEDKGFFEEILTFIKYLQNYYIEVYQKEIVEEPLLDGKEIMEILNIKPSKKVGEIKQLLLKEQIAGRIKTKKEAVEFIYSLK